MIPAFAFSPSTSINELHSESKPASSCVLITSSIGIVTLFTGLASYGFGVVADEIKFKIASGPIGGLAVALLVAAYVIDTKQTKNNDSSSLVEPHQYV